MEAAATWLSAHWFDLFQTVGIIGGLVFTAYLTRVDERARQVANSIAINDHYSRLWQDFYSHPGFSRVLKQKADLAKKPVSEEEQLFVNLLIQHLSTVFRAVQSGMFVRIEGLQQDIRDFFALPIPGFVWERAKPFQDRGFVEFIETCRKQK